MKSFKIHEDCGLSVWAGKPNNKVILGSSRSGLNQDAVIFISDISTLKINLRVDYLDFSDAFQRYCWDQDVEFYLFPTSYKEEGRTSNMANLDYNWKLDLPTPAKKSILRNIIISSKNCLEFREAVKNLINPALKSREFRQIDFCLNSLIADIWLSEKMWLSLFGLPAKTMAIAVNTYEDKFFNEDYIEFNPDNNLCYVRNYFYLDESEERFI